MSTERFAIYFAPSQEEHLWHLGSEWLGRDASSGEGFAPLDVEGVSSDRFVRLTASPRRYGFHATLKPPMRLRPGLRYDDLLEYAAGWAARQHPEMISLAVDQLDGFIALRPADEISASCVNELAAQCVVDFDRFRKPPSAAELERRRAAGLSERQEALLERWGYPYVFDQYRFHLTLTQRIEQAEEGEAMLSAAREWFDHAVLQETLFDGIAIYCEPAPGAAFELADRISFRGAGVEALEADELGAPDSNPVIDASHT